MSDLIYPRELPWEARIWCLKAGDLLLKNGKTFKVLKVIPPLDPGDFPEVEVEEID